MRDPSLLADHSQQELRFGINGSHFSKLHIVVKRHEADASQASQQTAAGLAGLANTATADIPNRCVWSFSMLEDIKSFWNKNETMGKDLESTLAFSKRKLLIAPCDFAKAMWERGLHGCEYLRTNGVPQKKNYCLSRNPCWNNRPVPMFHPTSHHWKNYTNDSTDSGPKICKNGKCAARKEPRDTISWGLTPSAKTVLISFTKAVVTRRRGYWETLNILRDYVGSKTVGLTCSCLWQVSQTSNNLENQSVPPKKK